MTGPVVQDLSGPHYIYRCYDDKGGLLYVGCSKWPLARIKGHRMNAWWGSQYDRHHLIVWPDRRKALEMEREAIWAEMPRCNIKGRWYRLDPREHWTALDYLDFHHALSRSPFRGEYTAQLMADVAAELLVRHNVSIADRSWSA